MKKKSAAPAAEKRSELFYSGRDCRAFDYMGAHPFVQDGEQGYLFRVYAPEAKKVSVMGEFNDWNRDAKTAGTTATFTPASTNKFYYFTQDTPLYTERLPFRDPSGQRHQGV